MISSWRSVLFLGLLTAFSAVSGELCPVGNFEGESIKPLGIRRRLPPKAEATAYEGSFLWELQAEKVHSGKKSLLLEEKKEGCNLELSLNSIPCKSGTPYEFSFWYYIQECSPALKVSSRIAISRPGQKPQYSFPVGTVHTGKWQQLKTEFYPPQDGTSISITVWFSGTPCKVYVDDFSLVMKQAEKSVLADTNTFLLQQRNGVKIWKQSSLRRIEANYDPGKLQIRSIVELTSAANEGEAFQIAVFPLNELKNVAVSISDFNNGKTAIPSGCHSYSVVRYIPMKAPDNPALKGEIADPLLPGAPVNAPAGKNTIFYVRIFTPEGTPAGCYTGKVTLNVSGKKLAEIPVSLKVRDFAIPSVPSIRTFFYGNPGMIKNQYHDPRSAQVIANDLSRIYRENRITGNSVNILANPRYEIRGDSLIVTDWSDFDRQVKEQYETYGQRDFVVPLLRALGFAQGWVNPKNPSWMGASLFSERAGKLAGSYARQFDEHWKKSFPADAHYYCYLYDEPPASVVKDLNRFMAEIAKEASDFPIFITRKADDELKNVHTYCVPFAFGFTDLELQKGKKVWYYNWSQPLDHPNYIRNRLFAWQIYANGGLGGLKWQTTSVPDGNVNPWDDLSKTYRNGDATTIYPAVEKGGNLVSSLRLAQIREGLDDADYLTVLEKKVERAFPGQGKRYVLSRIRELLPELPFGYVKDPELLLRLRERIGDEIENFDRSPISIVFSTPENNSETELSAVKFTILGPDNATVYVDGKQAGVIQNSQLNVTALLRKFGTNRMTMKVVYEKQQKETSFVFTRKQDANLRRLKEVSEQLKNKGVNVREEMLFLATAEKGEYTISQRKQCAALREKAEGKLTVQRLKSFQDRGSPLLKALRQQAQSMISMKLFSRASYYMDLAESFGNGTLPKHSPLSVQPVYFHDCFGFVLSNEKISVTILETGGRIISFKVHGKETLDPGDFSHIFPLKVRASQAFKRFSAMDVPSIGGYEDASITVLPESSVDWNLKVIEFSEKRIALEASMTMGGGRFRLSRIMSLVPNSPELKIQYSISNLAPVEFRSDDPSADQFNWRARLRPAIGPNKQGDTLEIPSAVPLKESVVDSRKPLFYEMRHIPLEKNYLRVFNKEQGVGLLWKLAPCLQYGYIWFDSRQNNDGPLYTLEVFRTSFFSKPGVAGNTPFTIEPGKKVSFTVSLCGEELTHP